VQKSGLTLSTTTMNNVVLVRLAGYLDGHTFIDLEKHLDHLIKRGQKRLVLDLSELGYIASAGVGLFIDTQHRLRDDGSVQLVNPAAGVREIFNILGLDTLFTIHQTIADGVTAAQV
jgi:anti-sigma B factor antagonist